ncbi:MAG: hypothetical protein BGP06_03275 [Rhizobiales bacterium 65-9]|nr:DUF58 domain-containing protein [Hyphomicrobiales bacterium]OJY35875.1 MAG: hypothetical protein BGP06_03275 [Rhizobiales bacterium 65-9]
MADAQVLTPEARAVHRRHAEGAFDLAGRIPRIVLEARRVAMATVHGAHGRRRAGAGENFWQFRPFTSGEPAARIDWRRSARDDRAFVREREWEAAHTIALWIDLSASMGFQSKLAMAPKIDRALVIGLALSDMLVRAGERVGLLGGPPASASREIIEKLAQTIARIHRDGFDDAPPPVSLPALSEAVIIGDLLAPADEIVRAIEAISARGARGHVLVVADPVEEAFPYSGHAEIVDLEMGAKLRVGDAAEFRARYLKRLADHRDRIRDACRRRGWSFAVHRTDRPASEPLIGLVGRIAEGRKG